MYKKISAVLILLCLLNAYADARGHDARVRRVGGVTADGLTFTVWVERQMIKSGSNIIVNYKVENRSSKSIYLVRDNTSNIVFEDDELIIFPPPLVPLGGHEPCDYSYTKIARGKSYQSRLIVAGDKYPKETRYAEQIWSIQIGFGYVTNIRGLHVSEYGDPAPCKALLDSRLKSLSMDGLIVEISKPLAHESRRAEKESSMKKVEAEPEEDELRPEYDLSQLEGRVRGKYAGRYRAGTNL